MRLWGQETVEADGGRASFRFLTVPYGGYLQRRLSMPLSSATLRIISGQIPAFEENINILPNVGDRYTEK